MSRRQGDIIDMIFQSCSIFTPCQKRMKGGNKRRMTQAVHYGTKPGHFEKSKIHFPMSEEVSEVSERVDE